MALLDYNRQTSFNVIPKEDFQELILSTFTTVSDVMVKSLGPLGSTTTIIDGQYTSATKDGWTIFNKLRPANIYKAMIFNLIKGPCSKLNNTVGDGTTTAIVLTNLLFQSYSLNHDELVKLFRLPREFNRAWDESVSDICSKVRGYARPISGRKIYDVAYVASNGNAEIAQRIQAIYDSSISPVIKLRISPTNESYVEAVRGYEFPTDLTDEAYVKNEDSSAIYNDIRVLLFDFKVESDIFQKTIVPLNSVYRAMGIKLLIIAPAYDEFLVNTTMKSYANTEWQQCNHQFNLLVSQYQYAKLNDCQTQDLAVLLGCEVINRSMADRIGRDIELAGSMVFDQLSDLESDRSIVMEPFDYRRAIGVAPKARLTVEHGANFTGFTTGTNQRYNDTLAKAISDRDYLLSRTEADKQNFSMAVGKANARIAQLQMETYMYYVGANSSLQFTVLNTAVDDVIKAVRSAVSSGVVEGCQLSIIRACRELTHEVGSGCEISKLKLEILHIIESATVNLYRTVLEGPEHNGIDDTKFWLELSASIENHTVYDIEACQQSDSIITSVETDLNVLGAASELIKLLISGNQCVYLDSTLTNSEDIQV